MNYVDQDQSRAFAPQPQPVQNQANYNHSNQWMVASWNKNSGGYGGLNLCTLTTSNRFHKLSTDDDEVDEHARDNSVDKNEAEMKSCGKVANAYTFGDVLQKAIKDRNELKQNKKWSAHDRKKHDRFRRRDNDEIEKAEATQKENMVTHDFKEQPKYTIACLMSATKLDIAEQHLCVNAVEDDYEKVSIMIDSGASETVAPAECFESYDLVKTTASGTTYASAAAGDCNEIVNIGEKFVEVVDENGTTTWAKFQVCRGLGKDKVLGSVSRLVQAGHRVVFQSPELGSYIENVVNGYRTYFRQSNGSYFLDMWVRRKVNDNSNNSGFSAAGHVACNHEPVRPLIIAPIGHEDELVGLKEKIKESRNKLAEIELDLVEHAGSTEDTSPCFTPTPDEYNKHCATHLPYKNWCPICVQSKKKNPAHRRLDDEQRQRQIPMISMDYMYLNEKSDMKNCPILVIHDSVSEGVWAIPVQRNGDDSYAKKRVCEVILRLGYSKIVIMSDQEFALADLEEQVRHKEFKEFEKWQDDITEECGCQVIIQNSPVGESAANGKVENAIQRIQDQIRAIKLD